MEKIKFNNKLFQSYKKVERGDKKDFRLQAGTISARKIKGYSNIYVSDNVIIKPKLLHKLNKYNNYLIKIYWIVERPDILIVDNKELNYKVAGAYLAITNIVVYPIDVSEFTQRHEMWHCKQVDRYKQKGGVINILTYNKYIKEICDISKQKIESLGINGKNALEISVYAKDMYLAGRFDEVDAEYEAIKGGFK